MRYRSFGRGGRTISALTLAVGEGPANEAERVRLVYAALEAGINAFELQSTEPDLAAALGKGLSAVERSLVLVSLRLPAAAGLRPDDLVGAIEGPILSGRLGRLDALILEDAGEAAASLRPTIEAAQAAGRLGLGGVGGAGAEEALGSGAYRLLSTPFHLGSGWIDRNRVKKAVESGAVVIGRDSHPLAAAVAADARPARGGFLGLGRRAPPVEKIDAYAFLRHTPGWSAEEICLAYALLEPALATVVITAASPEALEQLAQTPERELPTGLPAQIEMARFSGRRPSTSA